MKILNLLFERPNVTIRQVEAALDVPDRYASQYVEKFDQLGILKIITGHTRNQIFRADEILLTIEEPVQDK